AHPRARGARDRPLRSRARGRPRRRGRSAQLRDRASRDARRAGRRREACAPPRPTEAIHSMRMSEQTPEIFDDLYLGLQAGGALRKQRRGEELTVEEAQALSRWQRLSVWRKGLAIGAFAVGTFGLGFTVGGLVFGRWRKTA